MFVSKEKGKLMTKILLLMCSFAVFAQLATLLSAGICLLLYFILRFFHITKKQILSWFERSPMLSVCFTTIVSEGISLALLLPLCNQWFTYLQWTHKDILLCSFALIEILPAFYKFHKLKDIIK